MECWRRALRTDHRQQNSIDCWSMKPISGLHKHNLKLPLQNKNGSFMPKLDKPLGFGGSKIWDFMRIGCLGHSKLLNEGCWVTQKSGCKTIYFFQQCWTYSETSTNKASKCRRTSLTHDFSVSHSEFCRQNIWHSVKHMENSAKQTCNLVDLLVLLIFNPV